MESGLGVRSGPDEASSRSFDDSERALRIMVGFIDPKFNSAAGP